MIGAMAAAENTCDREGHEFARDHEYAPATCCHCGVLEHPPVIEPTQEHVDLLAQTMCAAFHADGRSEEGVFISPVWEGISIRQRGDWRRAARAALNTLAGNRHWLPR